MQFQGLATGYFAIILALVLQFVWLTLNKRGANAYISAITQYRQPGSVLGRMYGWSVRSVTNSILEGLLLISTIFFVVAVYSYVYATPEMIVTSLPLLAFVFLLSGASAIQMTRRVQLLAGIEKRVIQQFTSSVDKIGTARTVVQDLINRASLADSRLWFVLFRLASGQDQLGWSVRDVLMEKSKEIDGLRKRSKSKPENQDGTGIA